VNNASIIKSRILYLTNESGNQNIKVLKSLYLSILLGGLAPHVWCYFK